METGARDTTAAAAAMIGPMHPRDETDTEKPTEDRQGEEEDPFADYDSEKEEDKRMDDGGGSRGDSVEFAGNPAKEMCRHVISTEGESGSETCRWTPVQCGAWFWGVLRIRIRDVTTHSSPHWI
jgi:hypothetical protein